MSAVLSQREIDDLLRAITGPHNGQNDHVKDFALEVLTEKLAFFENKKKELLKTIEMDYDPNIRSLQKAINILQANL